MRAPRSVVVAALLLSAGCATGPTPAPGPAVGAPRHLSAADRVVAAARSHLDAGYRLGASGRGGFDCSGLTWKVFTEAGIGLPRTAEAQAQAGRWVPLDELTGGDLVFFTLGGGKPRHVGLVVSGPGQPLTMIHASSSQGVIETVVTESSYWLQRLRFGRRVLSGR